MNAVKFIEERNRMCGTMSEMWGVDAAQIVKNTEEWSAAHPLREYLDTELTPEEIDMDHEDAEQLRQLCRNCDLDRLKKLAEADKEGRVVVLPFTSGRTLLCEENIDSLRLMKDVELAIRYCSSCGIVFHMDYNVFCDLAKHGRITAVSEETEKVLKAMKNE